MKDSEFKKFTHVADNYIINSTGQEIMPGYFPDASLRQGNSYIILECDNNTSRKGFVGAMVKAAKFLTAENTGVAVFILKEKPNATVNQIQAHLQPYFDWIEHQTNLQAVYVIAIDQYCIVNSPIKLLDEAFMKYAKTVTRIVK